MVVRAAAQPAELRALQTLLWDELEGLGLGLRRDDISTWGSFPDSPPAQASVGLFVGLGLGQSRLMWTARALPGVRRPFELIWATSELITSMDAITAMRPISHDPSWRTANGWFHCDQSGAKPGRHAVQGQLLLEDQGPASGGFAILPRSHRVFEETMGRIPGGDGPDDFVPIPAGDPLLESCPPTLLCVPAGDMILWDSRLAHCSTSALSDAPVGVGSTATGLQRATCQICMTPRAWASEAVLRQRREAVETGSTGSHWPHGYGQIPHPVRLLHPRADPSALAAGRTTIFG